MIFAIIEKESTRSIRFILFFKDRYELIISVCQIFLNHLRRDEIKFSNYFRIPFFDNLLKTIEKDLRKDNTTMR